MKKGLNYTFLLIFFILRNLKRLTKPENSTLNNSLLLIAHPDDESMFFSPFLFYNSPNIILCLSNGENGNVRKDELKNLCKTRKWNCEVLNFKDGGNWDQNRIIYCVINVCIKFNIKNIVTFDEYGISGHKNHISCYKAMLKLKKLLKIPLLNFYCLKSMNLFEKYGFLIQNPTHQLPIYSFFSIRNMLYHKSQLIWFRYFYILISNCMNYNKIEEIQQKY